MLETTLLASSRKATLGTPLTSHGWSPLLRTFESSVHRAGRPFGRRNDVEILQRTRRRCRQRGRKRLGELHTLMWCRRLVEKVEALRRIEPGELDRAAVQSSQDRPVEVAGRHLPPVGQRVPRAGAVGGQDRNNRGRRRRDVGGRILGWADGSPDHRAAMGRRGRRDSSRRRTPAAVGSRSIDEMPIVTAVGIADDHDRRLVTSPEVGRRRRGLGGRERLAHRSRRRIRATARPVRRSMIPSAPCPSTPSRSLSERGRVDR